MMVVHQEDSLEDLQVVSLAVDSVEVFPEEVVPHDSKLKIVN
jgi:hypothetical protein